MTLTARKAILAAIVLACLTCVVGCYWPRSEGRPAVDRGPQTALLHLAVVPLAMPDGRPSADRVPRLLERVAGLAGGYTRVDQVTGGWVPPGEDQVVQESNSLLLVVGPPRVASLLKASLRRDFQQTDPFVISVPVIEGGGAD